MVLDEPFNWLDPVPGYGLHQGLRRFVDDGLTFITAVHNLGTLATACDAGLLLAEGRVAVALSDEALRTAARDPQAFERETIELLKHRPA